ncbi:nucleolar DEAD-box protein required for synthesis of 60S ribosomal [Salix suchowensis]|nr:nucleolar DEAD-box protein required for synthesis of 60S ribosomal [Salix suchowensis]
MREWPALQSDPITASMSSHLPGSNSKSTALDAEASVVGGSLLFVADNVGRLFSFLDGSYPTGYVTLQTEYSIKSLFQHSPRSVFTAHLASSTETISSSRFYPTLITMPLLDDRLVRDVAKSSTSAQKDSAAILDLTRLLLTGRSTEALTDLLGSGEQMSERGIQKWETTVSETLIKLRDFSEKRVTPAFQRLHLVLEEVEGWSLLPQYAAFEFSRDDVDACRHLCARGIVVSSWLASVARRELRRFASFVAWLRFSVNNLNTTNERNTGARYDVLEVNNYFMSGLQVSPIDKWFVGPIPSFTPEDLGVLDQQQPLQEVLEKARQAAKQGKEEGWRKATSQKDLDHIDRNLDALAQELTTRCQRIFAHAAGAVSRSASVTLQCGSTESLGLADNPEIVIRERIITQAGVNSPLLHQMNYIPTLSTGLHSISGHVGKRGGTKP